MFHIEIFRYVVNFFDVNAPFFEITFLFFEQFKKCGKILDNR